MAWRVGDPAPPPDGRYALTGETLPAPEWYGLRVSGGSEARQTAALAREGVAVRYPVQRLTRHVQGRKRITVKAFVPGLIMALFPAQPRWHVLKERAIIYDVVRCGEYPVVFHADIVARFMGLPTEAEAIAAAAEEAARVKPGDSVTITHGPFAGTVVLVSAVERGRVIWTADWGKGESVATRVIKTPG